ncbi:hypothetical protein EDD18DRAFT_1099423 [Armillaria luteobubalina]|uniref:Uncharacterized protein n=1 Tax=Armillaria luteobubalina TaxID=153913 RepID=A0AA39QJQ5_9AGAR|nr:hypothetical protein EDD18DRAFT_1099423 [Armillaria luteobubalina]
MTLMNGDKKKLDWTHQDWITTFFAENLEPKLIRSGIKPKAFQRKKKAPHCMGCWAACGHQEAWCTVGLRGVGVRMMGGHRAMVGLEGEMNNTVVFPHSKSGRYTSMECVGILGGVGEVNIGWGGGCQWRAWQLEYMGIVGHGIGRVVEGSTGLKGWPSGHGGVGTPNRFHSHVPPLKEWEMHGGGVIGCPGEGGRGQ